MANAPLLSGGTVVVLVRRSMYDGYRGFVQRLSGEHVASLFEGGNWDTLVTMPLTSLELARSLTFLPRRHRPTVHRPLHVSVATRRTRVAAAHNPPSRRVGSREAESQRPRLGLLLLPHERPWRSGVPACLGGPNGWRTLPGWNGGELAERLAFDL